MLHANDNIERISLMMIDDFTVERQPVQEPILINRRPAGLADDFGRWRRYLSQHRWTCRHKHTTRPSKID